MPTAGTPPEARAYHRFASVQGTTHCYVICGRSHGNRLCKGKQLIQIYDCSTNRWITPGGRWMVGGTDWRHGACVAGLQNPRHCSYMPACAATLQFYCPPAPCCAAGVVLGDLSPRSSLAAAAIDGGILVFGGATDRGERSDELSLLSVANNKLQWRPCPRTEGAMWPQPRGAHSAEVVGGRIYCAGGYGSVGGCDTLELVVHSQLLSSCGAARAHHALPSAFQSPRGLAAQATTSRPFAVLCALLPAGEDVPLRLLVHQPRGLWAAACWQAGGGI